jgi:hypothetical protein
MEVVKVAFDKSVYQHPDRLGAGAKRRRKLKGKDKIHAVMGEFKRGKLRSGSGHKVTSRKQAVAIAMSEARKKLGKKVHNPHDPHAIEFDYRKIK